jgi:formate-nitrite transporter family protein
MLTEASMSLLRPRWWAGFGSAIVAGWLMGVMAWLVTSVRDTISQIFFIWLIAVVIALAHLHHSVSGFILVFHGWLVGGVEVGDLGAFLLLATAGNAVGGILFAVLTYFRSSSRTL